jgi:hypothetical protein
VAPVLNELKVESMDRPWLTHQALAIKIYNCPFKFPQAFTVLSRLMLNSFEFAPSIMDVWIAKAYHILNLDFHIMKVLSNEPCNLMLWRGQIRPQHHKYAKEIA